MRMRCASAPRAISARPVLKASATRPPDRAALMKKVLPSQVTMFFS
jgi:hypothetical protein